MSGHSKWANIKRRKAVVDAQKGKIFSKVAREITVAAREGGGNPEANFRLKTAIEKARSVNLPAENVQRAIARGTGGGDQTDYEEVVYEGYGPGGIAVLLEIMTDNRNRTAGDIRHIFAKNGGNLGETGCVSWMFQKKGTIRLSPGGTDLDSLLLLAAEAGAEDVEETEDGFLVTTAPEDLSRITEALAAQGLSPEDVDTEMIPSTRVELSGAEAEKAMRLLERLEEHDDVQTVSTNADFPEDEE